MATRSARTAIVCSNDVLAFSALLEAHKFGIEVPQQLWIIGFDGPELTRHIQPALTKLQVSRPCCGAPWPSA